MSTHSFSLRPCPVCASTGARRTIHRQDFQDGVLGTGYLVVVCANCGAGFADGIPAQAEMDRYYAEQSKYSYDGNGGAESAYDMRRFELVADQVIQHLSSSGASILDIGCATGGLLSVFKQRGFSRVYGADPSPECAAAARRLHDVDVRTATLQQLAGWPERFDLVLMVGVLEHLRDVSTAIRIITRLLKPGGWYYAAVPDVEGLAGARNAPFQQFSMEHVNFFSRQSMDRLLAGAGLAPRQTWQYMVEWREGVTEPVLAGLYARDGVPPVRADSITEAALDRYIEVSSRADTVLHAKIGFLVRSQQPILVWGVGTLTRRLLATTLLGKANITAFVDSSPHCQGNSLVGRPVWAPGQLSPRSTEAILICSVAFEQEIVRAIREQYRLPNELIRLGST